MDLEIAKGIARKILTVKDLRSYADSLREKCPGDAEVEAVCETMVKLPPEALKVMAKQLQDGYLPNGKPLACMAKAEAPAPEPIKVEEPKPVKAKEPKPQAEKKDVGGMSMSKEG